MRDDEVWQTLVVPQRFSMRMVRAVDQAVSAGQHSYCEMRSASLCQQQRSWCLQAGMAQLQPSALGEFECCNSITEEQLVQRQWAGRARGGRGGSRGGKKRHQRKQKQKAKTPRQGAGAKKAQAKVRQKAAARGGGEAVDEVEPRGARTKKPPGAGRAGGAAN